METAFMSGTPVPIYVRRKKPNDAPTKEPRSSTEEVIVKRTSNKSVKPAKAEKSSSRSGKRKKIVKLNPTKDGQTQILELNPLNNHFDSSSRSSGDTHNTLWPLGAPLEPLAAQPAPSSESLNPSEPSLHLTVLLPPPPTSPLPQIPTQTRKSPPPRPLDAIGEYSPRIRAQYASVYSHIPEIPTRKQSLSLFPQPVSSILQEVGYNQDRFGRYTYDLHVRPLRPRPRTVSESTTIYMDHSYASVPPSGLNPAATYQHIQDMAAKRVSTLDYLRKTHEGRVYWFNTLLFNRNDISRLPSFDPKKLARRAHNFLILGLSLPIVLDLTTSNHTDFLKALNALLIEFETYQSIHPADGSNASSLSRARLPQMFKRSATVKTRRASSAADIGGPMGSDPSDIKSILSNASGSSGSASIAPSEELMPGEQYNYLVTPSIPFDPDFFEVFTSLCDVLIDCYMRITSLVTSPEKCGPGVAEVFAKADARLRKVIVAGIVKEFEDATRAGVKAEINGISKVVLGGLM